jgi:hypothetical protein
MYFIDEQQRRLPVFSVSLVAPQAGLLESPLEVDDTGEYC